MRKGLCLIGLVGLASCHALKKPEPEPVVEEPPKREGMYAWNGGDQKITQIRVNLDEQIATLHNESEEGVGWTFVASGISGFPTPTGEFKVIQKVSDKVSNVYGKAYDADGKLVNSDFKVGRDLIPEGGRMDPAKMPYFLRLTNDGIGMHVGKIPRPGKPASHGCMRMPSKIAAIMFSRVDLGTPVTITGKGPSYETYLADHKRKAIANAKALAAKKKKAEEEAAKKALAEAEAAADPEPTTPEEVKKPTVPETPDGTPERVLTSLPLPEINEAAPQPSPSNPEE
jgi:hypothetical protein